MTNKLEWHKSQDWIKLNSAKDDMYVFIDLKNGGSIQELKLKGKSIICENPNFDYADSYASSILFPFVNRLREGKYKFQGKVYEVPVNEHGGNAHHGLLFNKRFSLIACEAINNEAKAIIQYETKGEIGYPFAFKITLTYTIGNNYMYINMKIRNLSQSEIPYSVGWHPYFLSSDLSKSNVLFDKSVDVITDQKGVAFKFVDSPSKVNLVPAQKEIDDCFELNNNLVKFSTPDYNLTLSIDITPAFVHVFNPKFEELLAIELTSGISNSFNHDKGLDILKSGNSREVNWELYLE